MLKIKPFKQSPSFCGPACLKMIFGYYGVNVTEKAIGMVAKTTLEHGTGKKGIFKAAKHFGFTASVKDNTTIDDLKSFSNKKLGVIVDYYKVDSEPDSHYAVLLDVTKTHVVILDPEDGQTHRLTRTYFDRVWFGFTGSVIDKKGFYRRRCYLILPKKRLH